LEWKTTAAIPRSAAAVQLTSTSSTNRQRSGEPVDRGVGLAQAHERGVDDDLEQLVDRQHRPPARLPFADVVRQHRQPVPAVAQLPEERDHRLVRPEVGEVALAERVHLDVAAEVRAQLRAERGKEVALGHARGLELVHGVRAGALREPLQGGAHRPLVQAVLLLERGERLDERRREHAAEVADDGLDRAHRSTRARTS
jgi:hypothetical protein